MNTFAAAGLIAAAAAISTEATPTPADIVSTLDFSKYYDYGHGTYEYPSFDHKEELTPEKHHPTKKHRGFKTHNIDIFAHSSSDEESHHHGGYGTSSDHSSTSQSDSDTSADDEKHHKKHMIFLTGEGPQGDHCHDGDYCGKVDTSSDYTQSDYETPSEESHDEIIKIVGCEGGERCARVDFDWNWFGIDGTMDIFQPGYTAEPNLLFDADFDGLEAWTKYEVAVRTLPKATVQSVRDLLDEDNHFGITNLSTGPTKSLKASSLSLEMHHLQPDSCEYLGTTFEWLGSSKTDRNGDLNMRVFNDDVCMEDLIGRSVEIRGKYSDYRPWTQVTSATTVSGLLQVLACGNIVEVECP